MREMSSTDLSYDDEVAEPFRFNFEIAWEVANKGPYYTCTCTPCEHTYVKTILYCITYTVIFFNPATIEEAEECPD